MTCASGHKGVVNIARRSNIDNQQSSNGRQSMGFLHLPLQNIEGGSHSERSSSIDVIGSLNLFDSEIVNVVSYV